MNRRHLFAVLASVVAAAVLPASQQVRQPRGGSLIIHDMEEAQAFLNLVAQAVVASQRGRADLYIDVSSDVSGAISGLMAVDEKVHGIS